MKGERNINLFSVQLLFPSPLSPASSFFIHNCTFVHVVTSSSPLFYFSVYSTLIVLALFSFICRFLFRLYPKKLTDRQHKMTIWGRPGFIDIPFSLSNLNPLTLHPCRLSHPMGMSHPQKTKKNVPFLFCLHSEVTSSHLGRPLTRSSRRMTSEPLDWCVLGAKLNYQILYLFHLEFIAPHLVELSL